MSLVQVHNEWDPIEEIIVGNPLYAGIPEGDLGLALTRKSGKKPFKFPDYLIEETEEDIQNIIDELKKLNIKVRRPSPIKFEGKFKTLDWESEQFFSYCPRDVLLAIGDMVIESPGVFRSRYFETNTYKDILIDYMKSGSRWISAPKPRLLDEIYNDSDPHQLILRDLEPVFDAANVLRAGKDIFYLISDSGNYMGCQWLQSILGKEYTVTPCPNLYNSVHIDTTLVLLRPGLALINPSWVNPEYLPEKIKQWDIIAAPEMVEVNYSDIETMSSVWLGMNMLMLSPTLAMVDQNQIHLIKLLEKNGIDVVPILLRHGRVLGGGPHCITLDVRRKGQLENYFS